MFSSGYSKTSGAFGQDDDDDAPSGNMLNDVDDDPFSNNTSSSGFGSSSQPNRSSGHGDPFENRSVSDKDAWLKGSDSVNDPFNKNSNQKKSGSLLGSLSPFGKSKPAPQTASSQGYQVELDNDRASFGEFNSAPAPAAAAAAAAAPAFTPPGPIPNYYASPSVVGETPVFTCVSCYNRMSKNLATSKLKLEPNLGTPNANVNLTTCCDVCQRNLKQLRDEMLAGGLPPAVPASSTTTGIGNITAGSFPRPTEEMLNARRGSVGDGRTSFGPGNYGDGRASIESRGSDDMTAGMIRMQSQGQQKAGIFGGMSMFGGGTSANGKTY